VLQKSRFGLEEPDEFDWSPHGSVLIAQPRNTSGRILDRSRPACADVAELKTVRSPPNTASGLTPQPVPRARVRGDGAGAGSLEGRRPFSFSGRDGRGGELLALGELARPQ
jgi:hypothetical protein